MKRAVGLLSVLLVAWSEPGVTTLVSPSPTSTMPVSRTPSPLPAQAPLAAYDGPTLNGTGHVLYVVGLGDYGGRNCQPECRFAATETAKALFTVEAAARTKPSGLGGRLATDLPYVSTSKTHVYFLDGDATVRAIARDGKVTKVGSVPGTAAVHAAFAVSPNDDRLAVVLIDYSAQPVKETAYVANLDGSARVDLFSTTSAYYWPVGWHAGKVVLAMGPAFSDGSVPPNQYSATGYALVDTTAGAQPSPVGPGDCMPTGSVTPAGTACVSKPGTRCLRDLIGTIGSTSYYSSCLRRLGWDGKETNFGLTGSSSDFAINHAALSTDGHVIMGEQLFWVLEPGAGGYPGYQAGFGSNTVFNRLLEQPGMGWIDPRHVSMMFVNTSDGTTYQRIYSLSADYGEVRNVYFEGSPAGPYNVPRSTVVGQLIGTLPGGL